MSKVFYFGIALMILGSLLSVVSMAMKASEPEIETVAVNLEDNTEERICLELVKTKDGEPDYVVSPCE